MSRPILVASDGTSGSDGAARFATALAQATSRPLEVLAVQEYVPLQVFSELPSIPQGYSLQQSLDADDLRAAVSKRLARFDPARRWPVVMEIGRPAIAIAAHAHKVNAKMIVMGLGPQSLSDRLLGTGTSLKTVRLSHTPIVLVPSTRGELPRSALVGIDFSPFSLRAAKLAASLLQPGGHLYLVHVVAEPIGDRGVVSLDEYWKTYRTGVLTRLSTVAAELRADFSGIHIDVKLIDGEAGEELLALAAATNIELIAVGSNGAGFFSRLLLGSVSVQLIRATNCAVLVVPPEEVPAEVASYETRKERLTTIPEPVI